MRAREEVKVSGLNAVLAAARHRGEDIIRVYLVEERLRALGSVLERLAAERKAYHIVSAEELERVADTVHHEGVCALVKQKRAPSFTQLLDAVSRERGPITLLFLEDVKNPHNLGAILRVAANFGARAVITSGDESPGLSPALYRTAEGGAEVVDVVRTREPARALKALLRNGFRAYATSSHARRSLFEVDFAERSLVLLGAESEGLSDETVSLASDLLAIPGTGEVESLNVATAAAVVLAEMWRLSRPGDPARRRGSPIRSSTARRSDRSR